MNHQSRLRGFLLLLFLGAQACGDGGETSGGERRSPPFAPKPPLPVADASPRPRLDKVAAIRKAAAAPRSPADLGGRAWIESQEPDRLTASGKASFVLVYQAGPLGIVPDGGVFLQISPYWGWSPPQTWAPQAPCYTVAETDAADIELKGKRVGPKLYKFAVRGGTLREGQQVR
ncbi:MAG: hypothetical protein ACR2P8_03425, partial [Myxococcota bacterium]